MADDVRRRTAGLPAAQSQAAPQAAAATSSRAERARRSLYRGRFALIYVLLAGLAGAAVGATVVLLTREGPAPAAGWSEWKPVGSPERRAAQIADRIPDEYRLPSGNKLVTALSGPPSAPSADGTLVRMRAILVRPQTSRGQAEASDVDVVDARSAMMYILCGVGGDSCSIAEGRPSTARHALLRREALELALYTFEYVDGIESVVVLLPPRPDQQVATAVFLERSEVEPELSRPLNETLTAPTTPDVGAISPDELRVIERITRQRLYTYTYDSAQDGSPLMVLTPALA